MITTCTTNSQVMKNLDIKKYSCKCFLIIQLFLVQMLCFTSSCIAQYSQDSILKAYKYFQQLQVNGYDILVCRRDNVPKKTIVFISGSNVRPFFVNGYFIGTPFDIIRHSDKFNIIVVQKPGVPLFDDSLSNSFLDNSSHNGVYLDRSGQVPDAFMRAYNNNSYTKMYLHVIAFLKKQDWVSKHGIIVIGHSQGAQTAMSVVRQCKEVQQLVIMSPGNIFNRYYEFIREIRLRELYGKISSVTAQLQIDSVCRLNRQLLQSKDTKTDKYDQLSSSYSFYSFVYPSKLEQILNLKKRTLVIYGTAGSKDIDCDYLQLALDVKGNTNVFIRSYPGYDHNYFENIFDAKGNFVEQKFHWDDVMSEVLLWLQ